MVRFISPAVSSFDLAWIWMIINFVCVPYLEGDGLCVRRKAMTSFWEMRMRRLEIKSDRFWKNLKVVFV